MILLFYILIFDANKKILFLNFYLINYDYFLGINKWYFLLRFLFYVWIKNFLI